VLNPAGHAKAFAGNNHAVFAPAIETIVAQLRAAGKVVILIHGTPEIGKPAPETLARARLFHRQIDLAPTEAAYLARQAFVFQVFDHLHDKYGAVVVRPDTVLCTNMKCPVLLNGRPLYRDDHHLSLLGAMQLVPLLSNVI
jgi:hypothetical protein